MKSHLCQHQNHPCKLMHAQQTKALGFNLEIMVEEYLDGPEVDVDCVLSNGQLVYAHVVDNWYALTRRHII